MRRLHNATSTRRYSSSKNNVHPLTWTRIEIPKRRAPGRKRRYYGVNWTVLEDMRRTASPPFHEASYSKPVEYLPEATARCSNPISSKIEEYVIQTDKLPKVIIVMYSKLRSSKMGLCSEVGIKIV